MPEITWSTDHASQESLLSLVKPLTRSFKSTILIFLGKSRCSEMLPVLLCIGDHYGTLKSVIGINNAYVLVIAKSIRKTSANTGLNKTQHILKAAGKSLVLQLSLCTEYFISKRQCSSPKVKIKTDGIKIE